MLKTIIRKLKSKKIMTWTLMWFIWSVAIINVALQVLDVCKQIIQKYNNIKHMFTNISAPIYPFW